MKTGVVVLAFALAATSTVACKRSAPSGASPATTTAVSEEKPAAAPSTHAKLHDLEKHLKYGSAWGSDATAKKIADEAFDAIRVAWGSNRDELGVAVSIVPSEPRQVVIVAQVKDLKDADKGDRKAIADEVRDAIKDGLAPTDEVAFGVKGKLVYGIVATGPARTKWTVKTGSVVSSDALGAALSKEGAPAATAGKIGETLRVADMEWLVVSAKEKAKGETKVVVVQYKATNRAKKPRTLERAPKLIDAKGREFTTHQDEYDMIPEGKKPAEGQNLQPDLASEVWAAYEVPGDANGLRVKISGPYEYGTPGYVALGM